MNVLYVVNIYPSEKQPAAEPFVKAQIDSVRRTGAAVDVYCVRSDESKINYLKAVPRLRAMVRRGDYDVVHGHYVYSGWLAALSGKTPAVVSFMGSDLMGRINRNGSPSLHGRIDILLSRALETSVDGVIVKSKEMLKRLRRCENAMVLPNGVDFDVFRPMSRRHCLSLLGLEPDTRYILHIGKKDNLNKGYEIARAAVNRLQYQFRCKLLNVNGIAHHRMPVYMNASDVLVMPSLYEGSPNVVKEALACDLPVVATDVGDVREVIGALEGCTVTQRTVRDFARAIEKALARTAPFHGRSAIGHLKAEAVAARLLNFYERIIKKRKK